MIETRVSAYEAMILLNQSALMDLNASVETLRGFVAKAGGTVLAMSKWDDRRFAFEIAKQKRGMYLLMYFTCPTVNLHVLERECNLSETVLRSMVIRADHLSEAEMRATDARIELGAEATMRASARPAPEPEVIPEIDAVGAE